MARTRRRRRIRKAGLTTFNLRTIRTRSTPREPERPALERFEGGPWLNQRGTVRFSLFPLNSRKLSPVCSGLPQFAPVRPICIQSQKSPRIHGVKFGSRISGRGRTLSRVTAGHEDWRVGSQGVLALWQEREAVDRSCFCCMLSPGRHRPRVPPEPTGRRRSWRRICWPTESPRRHPGARAGPLRGRRTSRPIPFAWQWPAARPAPACRRKASGR